MIGEQEVASDGSVVVRFQDDLSPQMSTAIKTYSYSFMSISCVSVSMEKMFPGFSFDDQLLHRMTKRIMDN